MAGTVFNLSPTRLPRLPRLPRLHPAEFNTMAACAGVNRAAALPTVGGGMAMLRPFFCADPPGRA